MYVIKGAIGEREELEGSLCVCVCVCSGGTGNGVTIWSGGLFFFPSYFSFYFPLLVFHDQFATILPPKRKIATFSSTSPLLCLLGMHELVADWRHLG